MARSSSAGTRWSSPVLLAVLSLLSASAVHADERVFTYSYEPKTLPKGALEFEQWATVRTGKEEGIYTRWDLRSELEYGITDDLTTALYLNFKSLKIDNDDEDVSDFDFKGISSEWKYKLTDPTADALGSLLYGEVTTTFDELELEQKLVLGKNIGNFVLAFNAIAEQEWEFESDETEEKLELEFTLGAAYRVTNHFAVGIELVERNEFPEFERLSDAALFLGPAIHFNAEKWWVTLTVLPQIVGLKGDMENGRNLDAYTQAEVRLLLGIHF